MVPGQTGAGTSVRPICDEFAGGVSKLYDSELSIELVEALMTDDKGSVCLSHVSNDVI